MHLREPHHTPAFWKVLERAEALGVRDVSRRRSKRALESLEVAERINFLWDEGLLVPAENVGWRLTAPLRRLVAALRRK